MVPILIVDDSKDDLALAEVALRKARIANPLLCFHSGAEFLTYAEARLGLRAIVFVDLIMEPMSGLDVLRACGFRSALAEFTFVMLSGRSAYKILQEGYQLGACAFMMKPLKGESLVDELRNVSGLWVQLSPSGQFEVLPSASRQAATQNL